MGWASGIKYSALNFTDRYIGYQSLDQKNNYTLRDKKALISEGFFYDININIPGSLNHKQSLLEW